MLQKDCYPRVVHRESVDNYAMPERAQSSLKLSSTHYERLFSRTICESSDNTRMTASFYFLLLPIVYYVVFYAFSQNLFNNGHIADQHKNIDS